MFGVNEDGSIAVEQPIDGTGIEKPVNEEGLPVDSVEVQPTGGDAPLEEDVEVKVSEKKGKALSAEKPPEVEMKESEEKEGEVIDVDDLDVGDEPAEDEIEGDSPAEPEAEDDVLDLTKHDEPEMPIISGVDSMGGGVVKPDGAGTTTIEVTKDAVKVEMTESEQKLRKYIRNRLEEHAGLRKPKLNESKKSAGLEKLDRVIDKQFNLFESEAKKKVETLNEVFGFSVKEKFAKLQPNNIQHHPDIEKLFQQAFKEILINPAMKAIGTVAQQTPAEEKYELLKQYVENGGGTLRTSGNAAEGWGLEFQPKATKDAAIASPFAAGGTQGRQNFGGAAG